MTEALEIKITRREHSGIEQLKIEPIPFGKLFTDHMLEADFIDGEWTNIQIRPYQSLSLDPSLSALHYGQAIFEGIKAYKTVEGETVIFRPFDNFQRFNHSAERMCMPQVPEEIFIGGMQQLIALDKEWIPAKPEHALYIRPFMFSTDAMLGVKPSGSYKFMIILSPSGPYHAAPMKIWVEEKYTRAAPGGVGFAKNAGNYGGSLKAVVEAQKQGYDQVLWTDAFEHKWLQEVGMMNVIFIIDNKVVTPSLEEGTILNGVTRKSILTLLAEMGLPIEERRISIDELVDAYETGKLQEVFGTGTAATIALIDELRYKNHIMKFDLLKANYALKAKKALSDIHYGRVADVHQWLFHVC